jgi:rubrerythrin
MGEIKSTAENLQAAISGENYEWVTMYPPFIEGAEAEGQKRAKTSFEYAFKVEQTHEALYREALDCLSETQDDFEYYVCPVCGHTHARSAPDKCPVCGAPGARFEKVS